MEYNMIEPIMSDTEFLHNYASDVSKEIEKSEHPQGNHEIFLKENNYLESNCVEVQSTDNASENCVPNIVTEHSSVISNCNEHGKSLLSESVDEEHVAKITLVEEYAENTLKYSEAILQVENDRGDEQEQNVENLKGYPESIIMSDSNEEVSKDVLRMYKESIMYIYNTEEKDFVENVPNEYSQNLQLKTSREVQEELEYLVSPDLGNKDNFDNIYNNIAKHMCDICGRAFHKKSNLKRHYRSHTGDNPHACDECTARFPTRSRLTEHQRTHNGIKPYVCELCNKTFARISNLTRHYRTHSGEKTFQCDICNSRFIEGTRLREHYLTHTGEKKFSCDVCGKRFLKKYNLKRHIGTHNGARPHVCRTCGRCFSKKLYLLLHRASHARQQAQEKKLPDDGPSCQQQLPQSKSEDEVANLVSPSFQPESTKEIPLFGQPEPTKEIPFHAQPDPEVLEAKDIDKGNPDEQDEALFSCHLCTRYFIKESSLVLHVKKQHEEKNEIRCSVCNAMFAHESRLKEHFVTHSGEKAFPCIACGKRFGRNSNLIRHLQTHTGEKHHQCDICHKRYSSMGRLKEHYLTHSGAKPHACDVCGIYFRHKSSLQRHYLVHTGAKHFECDICHKRYNRRTRLATHYHVAHNKEIPQDEGRFLIKRRPEPRLTNLIQTLEERLGEPKVILKSDSCPVEQQSPSDGSDLDKANGDISTTPEKNPLAELIQTLEPKIAGNSDSSCALPRENKLSPGRKELHKNNLTNVLQEVELVEDLPTEQVTNTDALNTIKSKCIDSSSVVSKSKKPRKKSKQKHKKASPVLCLESKDMLKCDMYIKPEPEN